MDDERLGARLRTIDMPAEPDRRFATRLHDQLAAELELGLHEGAPGMGRGRRSNATRSRRFVWLAAAAALVLVLIGSFVVAGGHLIRRPTTSTLLDEVRAAGAIRIAVRPDAPQVPAPGPFGGFDDDVAQEVAARLGLRTLLQVVPADQMVGGANGGWDAALPSTVLSRDGADRFQSTSPYYNWPVYILVAASSGSRSMSDLDGATICAETGSVGESWLLGRLADMAGIEAAVAPPSTPTVRSLDDEQACLDDVSGGRSAGMVTTTLLMADLATRPALSVLTGRPVLYEGRTIVADRTGADPDTMIREIQRVLDSMRDDGTLADLSARRFGGEDLSVPPVR